MFSCAIRVPRSTALSFALAGLSLLRAFPANSQENAPGPLAPPPDHDVKRIVGVPQPEAPPSLPPAEIIKAFSEKEQLYVSTRPTYSYRKTIRIQELGSDGRPTGEYVATYDAARAGDGKLYEKAVSAPETSLEYLQFEPDDVQLLTRIPAFPVTASLLPKYNLQYLNTETVDEVECYIFQVSPKTLDRQHPLFDGVIWVDQKYLEVVKTYGRSIGVQKKGFDQQFPKFETYRQQIDGKYWFPVYTKGEGILHFSGGHGYGAQDVHIRDTIKYTDYKRFGSTAKIQRSLLSAERPFTTTGVRPAWQRVPRRPLVTVRGAAVVVLARAHAPRS